MGTEAEMYAIFHRIARGTLTLEQLAETAATQAGIYGEFLRRYLNILEMYPELQAAFRQALLQAGSVRVAASTARQLQGLGLVKLEGNEVRVRYGFYRTYFRERWLGRGGNRF